MGLTPIQWLDLNAWAQLTQSTITPYDAVLLRELSAAYCKSYQDADGENVPEPAIEEQELNREQVASKVVSIFEQLASRKK